MALKTLQRMAGYADLARSARRIKKSDDPQIQERARKHLVERMGKMRGLPQKLGQMLSFQDDGSDSESDTTHPYDSLQQQADPLPLEAIKPLIEQAWQKPVGDVLKHIVPVGHAASLGQVHQATMLNGQQVAVKVQYPDIRQAIGTDLKMLGWLSRPVGSLKRGFDLGAYRNEILEDLDRELDYCQEATQQRRFCEWARQSETLDVPEVVDHLCTDNVLVSQWSEGDSWNDVKEQWQPAEKRQMARVVLDFFLEGMFDQRLLHADWHPGNFRFRRGKKTSLLLYDFGCVYEPSETQALTLLRLIRATVQGDESPWPLLIKLGFNPDYLEPMAAKLPALCRVLFEPFCRDHPYSLDDWQLGSRVSDILGDDRWNFRIAGPAHMMFMLRAFHGLKYYLGGLDADIWWSRAITPYFKKYGQQMDSLSLPQSSAKATDFTTLAKYLKIRVTENGRTKVELTSPAHCIDSLDEMLAEDHRQRIIDQGIDLDQLISDVRGRGYVPGEIFHLAEPPKTIEVWLE